ncbi:MAG: IPT/TIG domain-containing protein [Cyclobacteriaceae bacterium]|nr:IPT/TIG domain-containing protein [Cyclobacteriaceae bacterium]
MKKRFYWLLIIGLVVITYACNEDTEPGTPPLEPPKITSIDPTRGGAGTEVIITGRNFSSTLSENEVTFNSVAATVVSATATQIVAKVPFDALTGKVVVTTSAGTASGPEFEYFLAPTILSLSPSFGPYNTVVSVMGNNVAPDGSGITIWFNDKEAEVVSRKSFQVEVRVPEGAGDGVVRVETLGGSHEGPVFDYWQIGVVTTIAGDGTTGFQDGPGATAKFNFPTGMAVDANDNVYVADRSNNRIRKITPDGNVSTLVGNGEETSVDGDLSTARIRRPTGLCFGDDGTLYFTESTGGRVRKITAEGQVTTIAGLGTAGYLDGAAADAQFNFPTGIAIDSKGNLFVGDFGNNCVRKIANGQVTTFAGTLDMGTTDGTGSEARFSAPNYIVIDADDNLFVSENLNHRIRKITPSGDVTTIAGSIEGSDDGPAASATFRFPYGLAFDNEGQLLIVDGSNNSIRMLDKDNNVRTVAGGGIPGWEDGEWLAAQFDLPNGIAVNSKGEFFVGDRTQRVVRKIVLK